ncbi:HpcH/HpaI aldolase/citrate lyase family protein [Alicycliphilus denitrificans]|uniref:CoA ester lyase n=1 Tax=Alicycliphilus denitrificans TaxID=179636 RepID=A0A3R7EF68_9BURK|nr:CoA ester lyase [Alicycliphilus denitrificans]RKJ98210.1 CoA ester lyase [Alicycliphilus denitrificans]
MNQTPAAIGAMRSVLYMPGDKERALQKIPGLAADVVVLDLEDAVAPEKKAEARERIVQALAEPANAARALVVRTNGVDTPEFAADLQAVARARPAAVLIPKYETVEALQALRDGLRAAGAPGLPVWAMVETPLGIADIARLADVNQAPGEAYPLTTLVIGTNDIARLTGTRMDDGRRHMLAWLSSVLIHAKARGLRVLDGVYNDFSDAEGFAREAAQARAMGFDGKTLIHPSQIEPANAAFAPTPEERAWAEKVVQAFALPENQGRGAIKLDGGMAELLHLEIARRLLAAG